MRTHMKAYVGAILLMLLFFGVMGMVSENVRGENDPPQPPEGGTVYFSGPWNITDTREYTNCTIIADGNITVKSGGNLILRNVTLKLNCSSDKQWKIDVWKGGEMHILDWDNDNTTTYDASNITVNDTSSTFLFLVRDGASFEMRNSEIHYCGKGLWVLDPPAPNPAYWGLYIETDNATIDHNLISNNYMGIVLYGSDATISNNTITWNDDTGIFSGYWSNGTIENNWITWNDGYGIWVTGGDNTHPKPSNPTIIRNVITDTGRGKDTADGIEITYSCKPFIKDTQILRSTEDGVFSGGSTTVLMNVTIDGGNYGISTSTSGTVKFINSTIRNTNLWDVSSADNHVYLINSSFDKNKITVSNSGDVYVQWYLNVLVQDSLNSPIPDANVRVKDNENGTYDQNFTTDNNGYVKWIVLTEYWQNSTTKIYYTLYNITVSYGNLTFINNPRNSTINESKTEIFTATGPLPEFDSVLIPVMIALFIGWGALRSRKRGQ